MIFSKLYHGCATAHPYSTGTKHECTHHTCIMDRSERFHDASHMWGTLESVQSWSGLQQYHQNRGVFISHGHLKFIPAIYAFSVLSLLYIVCHVVLALSFMSSVTCLALVNRHVGS